jgi:glycosyltransferase involved in cell wall biosynthesis
VESVLGQDLPYDDFEVIVVNDTAVPLPESPWQHDKRVRVMTTNRTERSVARNTGAAVALGEYLHFLDDDDWLLPGALAEFKKLATESKEALIYGTAELVDREGRCLVKLNLNVTGNCFAKVMAGEWIPIGSFIVKRDAFFSVGGFEPLMIVGQDIDLCRRIALQHRFAHTSTSVVSVLRGDSWDTATNRSLASGWSHQGLDRILNEAGSFGRILASADSPYWQGHVVRTYLGSMIWNLHRGRPLSTLGRMSCGIAGILVSGARAFNRSFWRGLLRAHTSNIVRSNDDVGERVGRCWLGDVS